MLEKKHIFTRSRCTLASNVVRFLYFFKLFVTRTRILSPSKRRSSSFWTRNLQITTLKFSLTRVVNDSEISIYEKHVILEWSHVNARTLIQFNVSLRPRGFASRSVVLRYPAILVCDEVLLPYAGWYLAPAACRCFFPVHDTLFIETIGTTFKHANFL